MSYVFKKQKIISIQFIIMELNWIMWERTEKSWWKLKKYRHFDALSAKEHWKTLEVVTCSSKHLTYYYVFSLQPQQYGNQIQWAYAPLSKLSLGKWPLPHSWWCWSHLLGLGLRISWAIIGPQWWVQEHVTQMKLIIILIRGFVRTVEK